MQVYKQGILKHGYLLLLAAWLFTISFIVNNYIAYNASPQRVAEKIEKKIQKTEKAIQAIISNNTLLQQLVTDTGYTKETDYNSVQAGIYIYALNDVGSPILTFWNSNKFSISLADITKEEGIYFKAYPYGYIELIKRDVYINSSHYLLIAAIPIQWKYFVENKYLATNFDGFDNIEKEYEITTTEKGFTVQSVFGKKLFSIQPITNTNIIEYSWLAIVLRIACIAFIIIFINRFCKHLINAQGFTIGFSLFLGIVLLLRIATYFVNFPFKYEQMTLFDPSIYASNAIHPSLGHLFINVGLLFWIISFYKFYATPSTSHTNKQPSYKAYGNIIILILVQYLAVNIVSSLVIDSKISFQVTQFFSLTKFTVICFIVLALIALSFYHLASLLLLPFFTSVSAFYKLCIGITVGGLLLSTALITSGNSISVLLQTLWLIIFTTILFVRRNDVWKPLANSPFFIFWVMFFAASITWIVSYKNQETVLAQKKKIAERISIDANSNNETILGLAISSINTKLLSNSYKRLTNEVENKTIKDSIIRENFAGFLNRFETNIFTYAANAKPLFNDDTTINFFTLKNITNNKAKATTIKGLYTVTLDNNKRIYLYETPLISAKDTLGYLYIVAKNKPYKSEALYPVLFNQNNTVALEEELHLSYAVYANNKLVTKYNFYDFPLTANTNNFPIYQYVSIEKNNATELWYNDGNKRLVVIVQNNQQLLEWVTLFAYLFFSFISVVAFFHFVQFIATKKLLHPSSWFISSIRFQIHTTIIFISVFSFAFIGISSVQFFTNRFTNNTKERLSNTINIIAGEINNKLKQVQTQLIYDEKEVLNELAFSNEFEQKVTEISLVHNVDINFYGLTGNLLASTQPYIYTKQILNNKIDANALYKLRKEQKSLVIQEEYVGKLKYLSVYIPLVDEMGNTAAYLHIPYLNAQIELNQEISSFIATLINLNAFVFLIAGAIAFLLTERVVKSFSIISKKMQETSIAKENQPIVWNKKDEIGLLVEEYNKMVHQLNRSIQALKQTEREGAWREMAKQVAHEIKNPLTPMKLSLQYLQQAIQSNSPNAKELAQRVSNTLIEQINQLSNIANDFSQFANIGTATPTRTNIQAVLQKVIELHQLAHVTFELTLITEPVYVYADETQLNRLFTNLIKNSIEATPNNREPYIHIQQQLSNNSIITTITDNGTGIPTAMLDRIFTPNFTTKSSGTGLGLAICKSIVEKFGGSISFSTKANEGTSFTIQFETVQTQQ